MTKKEFKELTGENPEDVLGGDYQNTFDAHEENPPERWKPCGEGDNICNCKQASECGYIEIYVGIARLEAEGNFLRSSYIKDGDSSAMLVI